MRSVWPPLITAARDVVVLVTPMIVLLTLVSSQLEFNHHIRYVLPVLGFLCVFAGVTATCFTPQRDGQAVRRPLMLAFCHRSLVVACLLATAVSTLRVYPHQLAYFNQAAGGPANGYKHLLHSNLDWEQDLLLIEKWIQAQNIRTEEIRFSSYYPFPASALIEGVDASHVSSRPRWEIVSIGDVVQRDSKWITRCSDASSHQIGYVVWAFRVQ